MCTNRIFKNFSCKIKKIPIGIGFLKVEKSKYLIYSQTKDQNDIPTYILTLVI